MADARGLLELTRPGNALAAGLLTFVGAFVAGGVLGTGLAGAFAWVAAVVATVLAVGAGMAINDYFDREIDRMNRPDRPIPSGVVSPREALAFSGLLFGVAVALAVTLPALAVGIAVVNLLALVAYTEFFKGLPGLGNALVGYLTGSTFLFGGAAVGGRLESVLVLFALASLATFAREVVKDVEDVAGDREEGLRTLPIVVGSRPALWVGVAAMLVAVAASVVPFLGEFGVAYLVAVLPADVALLYATRQSFSDPAGAQRMLKRGMFVAAAAFVVGRAAVVYGM
jgi:geranylgeranylglycerol-phosphate geranylgeranyltransferase